jgi:hypothetical protein
MKLSTDQKAAIKEIAEHVVTISRPSELILVKRLNLDKLSNDTDEMLGFDAGVLANIVLPHLIVILKALATAGAVEFAKKWGKALADLAFQKRSFDSLDAESLNRVAAAFRDRLILDGRDEEESLRISNVLVVTLVSHPALLHRLIGTQR